MCEEFVAQVHAEAGVDCRIQQKGEMELKYLFIDIILCIF